MLGDARQLNDDESNHDFAQDPQHPHEPGVYDEHAGVSSANPDVCEIPAHTQKKQRQKHPKNWKGHNHANSLRPKGQEHCIGYDELAIWRVYESGIWKGTISIVIT